jgi:hypothetical protein
MPAASLGTSSPFSAEFPVANRDWVEFRQRRVRVAGECQSFPDDVVVGISGPRTPIGKRVIVEDRKANRDPRTLLSKCLHDVSVALDYLVARPEVDPLRVGFIGHSYGGKMAIWAPALDNRIRASVSNCGCVGYKPSLIRDTGVQMEFCLPGVLQFGDIEDIVRLVAPRALLLQATSEDVWSRGATAIFDTLNQHLQKESSSFDVGQVVMSSHRKCDKRHIVFLTSISREGITQTTCSSAQVRRAISASAGR